MARVEQTLIGIAKQQEPDNCNCRPITVADQRWPEKFEAELNQTCPTHGVRRLGWVVKVEHIGQSFGGKLEKLLQIYEERKLFKKLSLSKLQEIGLGLKRGSQEP